MKGPEIRAVLLDRLSLIASSPFCKVICEVGLPGSVVDVLVVDESLRGYEIKGQTDSLKRLSAQAESYNDVLQAVTLVAAPRHIRAARKILPEWWGLTVADGGELRDERAWQRHDGWNAAALLAMLWKVELTPLMKEWTQAKGIARMTNWAMCEALAEAIPRKKLPGIVADTMVARQDWGRNRVNPA